MYVCFDPNRVIEQEIPRGRGTDYTMRGFMSGTMEKTDGLSVSSPPSFAELAAALKSLQQPPEPSGLGKHVATIVVAATLAIGAWVVSGVSSVQTTLGRVQVTVDATKQTTDDMRRDIRAISDQQSDMKAEQAELKQRVDALERAATK